MLLGFVALCTVRKAKEYKKETALDEHRFFFYDP
jgi:hypothetical protein